MHMKKRLRKKIARKVTTIKVSKGILQISDKICPICGIHIVKKIIHMCVWGATVSIF